LAIFDDEAIKKSIDQKKLASILDPVFALQKIVKSYVVDIRDQNSRIVKGEDIKLIEKEYEIKRQ
jgi:hypothetical protein